MTTAGKSLMEKLKTLTSKSQSKISKVIETPTTFASPTITNSSILKSLNNNGNDMGNGNGDSGENEGKKGILNILKYLLIIVIIGFVVLNILAIIGLLPIYLAELFNPLLFLKYSSETPSIIEKEPKLQKEKSSTKKKEPKESNAPKLATSIDEDSDEDKDINPALKELETITKKVGKIYPVAYDNADSKTQLSKPRHKSGYCYIGEDRGFRSCIKVNEKEKCDSGDIFPTKDICINPKLRA